MIVLPDNLQRAKNSLIAFYILGFIQIVFIISSLLQYSLLKRMQNGNYTAAEAALMQDFGKYTLVPNFSDNFDGDVKLGSTVLTLGHEFNAESIFEVSFVDKGDDNFNWGYNGEGATADESIMRSQEYGIVWGNVVPSNLILNEFEPNDPRYKFTFYESGDNIVTMGALSRA